MRWLPGLLLAITVLAGLLLPFFPVPAARIINFTRPPVARYLL